jgi:hypothetical protein
MFIAFLPKVCKYIEEAEREVHKASRPSRFFISGVPAALLESSPKFMSIVTQTRGFV